MKKRQQGLTTVEAAIGAALMLIVLFGTIEIARALFVWNFLDEVTRRGARVAAVCPIDTSVNSIARRVAIFSQPGGPNQSPHVNALTTSDVLVQYLRADGTDGAGFEDTKFVRASIDSFELPLMFFNNVTWTTPGFITILPSESLGYDPDEDKCWCFGILGTGADGCG